MNKKLQFVAFIAAVTISLFSSIRIFAQEATTDSVMMGPGYANEVYYSMTDGKVMESPRDTWDIAFRTMILSSSILTNDGKNVVLYTYPNSDTSGWASVDTTGLFGWTPMFNDPDSWENGAFMRNATGGFDFGWGVYNMTTHNLTGDSLYVIKLRDGSFKKLWIVEKKSSLNKYIFRSANLDGSNDIEFVLDCGTYIAKDFIGFSLTNNTIVDYQPAKNSWDLVFTKYMSVQPNGMPYPVTGVLQNENVAAEKYTQVAPDFIGYNPYEWDSTRSVIGYDWKFFDGTQYVMVDSMVNFVKNLQGEVYKILFTEFVGSSTGKIAFEKSKLPGLGIEDPASKTRTFVVFPNPVKTQMNISFVEQLPVSSIVSLYDLSSRMIFSKSCEKGVQSMQVDVSNLPAGLYLLKVTSGSSSSSQKIIITR